MYKSCEYFSCNNLTKEWVENLFHWTEPNERQFLRAGKGPGTWYWTLHDFSPSHSFLITFLTFLASVSEVPQLYVFPIILDFFLTQYLVDLLPYIVALILITFSPSGKVVSGHFILSSFLSQTRSTPPPVLQPLVFRSLNVSIQASLQDLATK